MDMNHQKLRNTIWELGVVMEDQNLHDHHQVHFDHTLWQNFPLQTSTHQHHHHHHDQIASSSSTQLPISGGVLENPIEIRGGGEEEEDEEEEQEELGAMKEMMYKIAAMQPVDIDPATIRKPKRRNVRISDDPQSVAARHRRERISEKIRILQRLVPGGTKMDTASMLDEAVRYVKFLKRQIRLLQQQPTTSTTTTTTNHHHHHVTTTTGDWPYTHANKAVPVLPNTSPPLPLEKTGYSYMYGGSSGDPSTNMR